MRILILHSRYRSGPVSGENRVVQDEAELLRRAGHTVEVWDPEVRASSVRDLSRAAVGMVWSKAAVDETRRLVASARPDVVHCHNLYPALSPSVLRAVASEELPLVVTLHNFRFLCLPGTLFRDGHVCEDCLSRVPWRGIVHACYRESALESAALASSLTLHRSLGTFERPSLYAAVSEFVRRKHVEAGWDPDRITVKPNFAWATEPRRDPGGYFLYLGRLSEEKGIRMLVEAFPDAGSRLRVVGDGPLTEQLRSTAGPNVDLLGSVSPTEISSHLKGARALLVPSQWFEGHPRSIIEAYAAGVPVVAGKIGGLPEVVKDHVTGLLVDPSDPADWRTSIEKLGDDDLCRRLGAGALNAWTEQYSPERGLQRLEDVYRRAMTDRAPRS